MKFSIITVSYNSEKTIEQTILSVLNQTYRNIEYIIIDGGSTDRTLDVIKRYENKIAYWISEPDNGIYDAMNKGIKVSNGDYIQIVGSDDCLLNSEIIQRVADCIDPQADLFSTARIDVDERYRCERLAGNESAKSNNGQLPWVPHSGVFVKKELMRKKLFDTSYKIAADLKFLLECYFDPLIKIQYADFPTVYFSCNGISSTDNSTMKSENARLLKELGFSSREYNRWFCSVERNCVKEVIRHVLDRMGLLGWFLCCIGKWKRHHCENEMCRWCKRM